MEIYKRILKVSPLLLIFFLLISCEMNKKEDIEKYFPHESEGSLLRENVVLINKKIYLLKDFYKGFSNTEIELSLKNKENTVEIVLIAGVIFFWEAKTGFSNLLDKYERIKVKPHETDLEGYDVVAFQKFTFDLSDEEISENPILQFKLFNFLEKEKSFNDKKALHLLTVKISKDNKR